MKQTLEEAAYDYATNKTKFRKEVLKEVDSDNYVSRKSDCMEDFQCGAEWHAKQSQWISANKYPPIDKTLLLNYSNGSVYDMQLGYYDGCHYCNTYGQEVDKHIVGYMPIPSFDEILEANRDVLERIKEKGD